MRRGKLNQKAILYIIFAAVFTLLSYFLDQQVIQKEDTTRKQEAETERLFREISSESANSNGLTFVNDGVLHKSNYFNYFSTIYYKILLQVENNEKVKNSFNPKSIYDFKWQMYSHFIALRETLQSLYYQFSLMPVFYTGYENKEIKNKINNLYKFEDKFFEKNKERLFNVFSKDRGNIYDKLDNFTKEDWKNIYKETILLNKTLFSYYNSAEEILDYIEKKREKLELDLEKSIEIHKRQKVLKNYFILFSILFQILGLLAFLFLFKNFVKDKSMKVKI